MDNYAWTKWPEPTNATERMAQGLVKERFPKTITITLQGAAVLLTEFVEQRAVAHLRSRGYAVIEPRELAALAAKTEEE